MSHYELGLPAFALNNFYFINALMYLCANFDVCRIIIILSVVVDDMCVLIQCAFYTMHIRQRIHNHNTISDL